MSSRITPSKRPFERNPLEPNGRGKWRKTSPSSASKNRLKPPLGGAIFRLLCPVSKVGDIFGNDGSFIAKISQDTGAKVTIEEIIPRCEERVVVFTDSEKEVEPANDPKKEDSEDKSSADGGDDAQRGGNENDVEKEDSVEVENPKLEKLTSCAQKALLLVCDRLIEGVSSNDVEYEQNKNAPTFVRLVISSSQVGSLLGKGGSMIKQMSADSGAQIRIMPKDNLPFCASTLDDIVQITGTIDSTRKALQSVSQHLLENPPRERDTIPVDILSGPSSSQLSNIPWSDIPRPEAFPPGNHLFPVQRLPIPNRPYEVGDHHLGFVPPMARVHESVVSTCMQIPPEIFTLRLLCSNDKVGCIIGKGGNVIRTLQHETGCDIKVLDTIPDSEDRIVLISGPSLPDDRLSPAQDAILRILDRLVMSAPDGKEAVILKLLVAPNQAGCVLGKSGSVISEMRKLSGAQIRLLSKDQVPKSVENDEIVQVSGQFRAIQEALVQITTKLRHHLFHDKLPVMDQIGRPPFIDKMPPFGPYPGRRESPSHSMFSNIAPFHNFDPSGRPFEDRLPFGPMHGSSFDSHMERFPPMPWDPQGAREGKHLMPMPDYLAGGPHKRIGGFPGGSHSAIITNTTVDVVIPRALIPAIYGEDGGCLKRIREISEAKITIIEPRPEEKEAVIVISGAPDQTHAAQSLLQAFVVLESSSL